MPVDAYTRAQTAQFIGGALDTFAQFGLQQLYRKNEQERIATMEVAGQMAEQGMLDALPGDVWKNMAKNMGQNYADLLMQRNAIRKRMLAPRRQLQQGVQDFINAPMYELVPGQQLQQPPVGDTLDEQYGPSTWPANRPPATQQGPIPVGSQSQLQALQQRAQQQAQATGQPSILEGYQVKSRPPTNVERFIRADNLSPFGAALLTDSTELGQLAGVGQTLKVRQAELEFKKQKQAFDEQKPTFGPTMDITDPEGNTVKGVVIYTPTGGIEHMTFGEGRDANAMQRVVQKLRLLQEKKAKGGLTPTAEAKLDEEIEQQQQIFEKLTSDKPGMVVNAQQPAKLYDTEGNVIAEYFPGDKPLQRWLMQQIAAARGIDNTEMRNHRLVISSGNLALTTLNRLAQRINTTNVGLVGKVRKLSERAIANIEGGQDLLNYFSGFKKDVQGVLWERVDPKFRSKLKTLTTSPDSIEATLNTLTAIYAKFADPGSTIREEEFNRIRSTTFKDATLPAMIAGLAEAEAYITDKINQSSTTLSQIEETALQLSGALNEPGGAPGPDPGRQPVNLTPFRDLLKRELQPATTPEIIRDEISGIEVPREIIGSPAWNASFGEIQQRVNTFINNNPQLSPAAKEKAIRTITRSVINKLVSGASSARPGEQVE